jgi:hypothetical protein
MYVVSVDPESIISDTELKEHSEWQEVFYWRKHYKLHAWFHDLYFHKGAHRDSEFNCSFVRVVEQDLVQLEPHLVEFSEANERTLEIDLNFMQTARDLLRIGSILYYSCSW